MTPEIVVFRHNQDRQLGINNAGSVVERARIIAGDELFVQGLVGVLEASSFSVFVFDETVVVTVRDPSRPKDGGWEAVRMVPGEKRGPWRGDPAH